MTAAAKLPQVGRVIPNAPWPLVPLGEIADIKLGKMLDKNKPSTGRRLPYLRNINVRWGRVDTDDLLEMPFDDDQLDRFGLKAGDVLVCEGGEPGRAAVWDGHLPDLKFQKAIHRVRFKSPYDPRLLVLHLELLAQTGGLERRFTGSTIKHFTREAFIQLPVPLIPLLEQRQIVAEIEKQFTRLDAGIAALRRTQANLKRYRAAVLKAACEGRLVPTEVELAKQTGGRFESGDELMAKIGNLAGADAKPRRAGRMWGAGHVPDLTDQERLTMPKGWAWIKVRDVGFDPESAVQVGPMSMKSEDFTDNGVPVLNVGCVQWDRFVESKLDHLPATKASDFDRYRIRPGDVLFTRSGTVGRCAVAQSHQDGWLMTFHLLRARPNPKKCVPEFLRMVFEGAPHIRRQTKAASVGTTRAGFNTNLLASLDVPLPPLAEQSRIVAEVERRLSVVEELETVLNANLQRATRLRQAILNHAFSS
jgi:type I restriction enzyme S subunit